MMAEPDPVRRAIPDVAVETVWQAPDGHELRRIDWPSGHGDSTESAARGSLLFVGGRGDAYEKYLETLAHWHRGGWDVTALDWRGQAGSGRLGMDSTTGHVDDFGTWIDDIGAFWAEWSLGSRKPDVMIGHSMGGHLALRAAMEGAAKPDALVLVAPMLGFAGPPLPLAVQSLFARLMASIGDPRRPAWKWSEKPGELPEGRPSLLTHDASRYSDEEYWRKVRPELVMGAASWGWVAEAADSMRFTASAERLRTMRIPTLILSTAADRLVSPEAILRAHRLLPDSRLLEFGSESAHEILREVDVVRDRALAEIDSFLGERAPPVE